MGILFFFLSESTLDGTRIQVQKLDKRRFQGAFLFFEVRVLITTLFTSKFGIFVRGFVNAFHVSVQAEVSPAARDLLLSFLVKVNQNDLCVCVCVCITSVGYILL